MFILSLIRFLRGYVSFIGKGGFPERFLNLCAREEIGVWNVKHSGGALTANVAAAEYHLLRPCAAKAGMKLSVSRRIGFSFLVYRYRKRVGVLVGAAVFVLILTFSSNFVWTIRVEGNDKTDASVILHTMEELGLRAGVMRSKIEINETELEALRRLSDLSWVSVNIRGSVATVEVRERTPAPEMLDESVACNVVAARDGCIVRIEAYEGNAKVRVGEAVVKGDLLISGVMESKLETTRFVHARGNIIASTSKKLEAEIPLVQERLTPTGQKKKKYSVELFGIRIPLYFSAPKGEEWQLSERENRLRLLGRDLPFAFFGSDYTQVEKVPFNLSTEEAKAQARQALNLQKQALGDVKIISVDEKYEINSSVCKMVWELTCEENIGVSEEILFEYEEQN